MFQVVKGEPIIVSINITSLTVGLAIMLYGLAIIAITNAYSLQCSVCTSYPSDSLCTCVFILQHTPVLTVD